MGKKKKKPHRIFPKNKKSKSLFRRPHPMKRKMKLKQRRMRAFIQRHDPRAFLVKGVRKFVGGIYMVSDKVRDKIAESTQVLNNPFSAQFYEDRCVIQ